jgi:hypothetical protein
MDFVGLVGRSQRKDPVNLIPRLYAVILRLYPGGFRREFGEEMQEAFSQALQEAAGRGRSAPARIFLRELGDLPASLLSQFDTWTRSPMLEGASLDYENSRPGSWFSAGLAALPHLLFALALYLPLLVTVTLDLPDYRGPSLPVFWGLVVGVLAFSRRLGWPRWSASWIGYGLVLLLAQISLLFPHGPLATLTGFAWLALGAVVLFWLARRDWIGGLLAVLPASPMWVWLARLDGPPASLELAALYLSLSLVIAFAVVAIMRLGRWQTALLLLLLVILATGMPDSNGVLQPGQTAWSGAGNWMAGYVGMLVLTAPLWLMALWRQVQRR